MTNRKHNQGRKIFVELTEELADFVVENCEKNLEAALSVLMASHGGSNGRGENLLSKESMVRIVEMNEKFKAVLKAVKDAQP